MQRPIKILFCFLMTGQIVLGQNFGYFSPEQASAMWNLNKPFECKKIFTTSTGSIFIGTSVGLMNFDSGNLYLFTPGNGVKCITEGPGKIIYFVSDNNNLGWIDENNKGRKINYPPFNFPGAQKIDIKKIWIDGSGDLFVAAVTDTIYVIKEATKLYDEKKNLNYSIDNKGIVKSGAKRVEKIIIGPNIIPYSFADSEQDDGGIYVGTNKGIFFLSKWDVKIDNLFEKAGQKTATITNIKTIKNNSEIWFSTLEKGMGFSNDRFSTIDYFPYKKGNKFNSIQTFASISDHYFLTALGDSVPALFNTLNGEYSFIQDTSFKNTQNKTTDININSEKNIFIIKGGGLFVGGDTLFSNVGLSEKSEDLIRPSLMEVQIHGQPYGKKYDYLGRYDSLKRITLKYYENKLSIYFAMRGANSKDTMMYQWKMDGYRNSWERIEVTMLANKFGSVDIDGLKPGKYVFRMRAKIGNEEWLKKQIELTIIIKPPFWLTWWFWTYVIAGISLFTYIIVRFRVRSVRKYEREKARHGKELLEMEARALRAQMNPHFIFNCLNSIKSLIQQNENIKSVTYLTTFSKLIRTLLNNADKKEISLYDEIETCKLYLQLEAMRFDTKFSYAFDIDDTIDLKSIQIPALIIQPFIENAIWHGIVPRNSGGTVSLNIQHKDGVIEIVIDDDGIGREASQQNKSATGLTHQSKGVNLTQTRLELNNLLQQRQAALEVIDKKDELEVATGTTVIIKIKEELS